jgi:short chain dehydrogenase
MLAADWPGCMGKPKGASICCAARIGPPYRWMGGSASASEAVAGYLLQLIGGPVSVQTGGPSQSRFCPSDCNMARHRDRRDMPSVAVVTGASSGIGLATTRALAAAGWNVIATARRPETAESLRGIADELSGVELRTLDVTSDESVEWCIGSVLTDLGGIGLLVNNAGAGHRGTLEQLTMDELSQAMALNFFGVARVTKAVLPCARPGPAGSSP